MFSILELITTGPSLKWPIPCLKVCMALALSHTITSSVGWCVMTFHFPACNLRIVSHQMKVAQATSVNLQLNNIQLRTLHIHKNTGGYGVMIYTEVTPAMTNTCIYTECHTRIHYSLASRTLTPWIHITIHRKWGWCTRVMSRAAWQYKQSTPGTPSLKSSNMYTSIILLWEPVRAYECGTTPSFCTSWLENGCLDGVEWAKSLCFLIHLS